MNQKAKAFIRTFVEAKVSLKDNCFYELVPKQFLIQYSDIKCKIIDYVLANNQQPADYDFRFELEKLLMNIKLNKLSLNFDNLKADRHDTKVRDFICIVTGKQIGRAHV